MLNNEMTEKEFVARVLNFYLHLPQTPARTSRTDRQLAAQWYAQGLTWETLEGALLLATARRSLRDPALPPLSPIRSLHYFVPLLEEVQATPLAPEYMQYLRGKLAAFLATD
ncbi:MAG TPA: hypothetical protein PKC13_25405 [Blastocatellia bacterium]|nr:hypothetical protein [Blastocatellia bacterium]HMV85646.1 hypothetical protein [Blastocatellia bacterium]HMX28949.1 hypothetical protein [Blastocatellia bacterium]HNG29714.1 hypothetical protein [Blastocatellia bacterium]